MASAALSNHQNETNWKSPKFMGKATFPKSNPNPNPNRLIKKRQFHHDDVEESPVVTQSVASDDASSINRRPSCNASSFGTYVNFAVSSYSKSEVMELKHQFRVQLEQIRQLRGRIESHDVAIRSSSGHIPVKKGGGTLSKKILGNKRSLASDVKRMGPENTNLMKSCGQILNKLMKHKFGHIFNSPVDPVGLGLHDYFDIVKSPMDLGTVKSKLMKNLYDSPFCFAADVRLTFNNAMLYNPIGHEIHALADQLLTKFEDSFRPISQQIEEEEEMQVGVYEELQASSWERSEPLPVKKDIRPDTMQQFVPQPEQIRVPSPVSSPPKPPVPPVVDDSPVSPPQPEAPVQMSGRPVKLPKPKAKDPNKREMSLEEKHKLGMALQNLPPEKMENVVNIIKKRNGHLTQDGDEIELDIEAVDTETLWELDRFVTYYKKMVSKMKRQALLGNLCNNGAPEHDENKELPVTERADLGTETKKVRKGEAGEEDVDIGDEMPMSTFPPVEIEKDNGHASNSSSSSGSGSSSDSSSGSDSDSGSSSRSDSDADDARS